jgi:hypothetical protein
MAKPYSVATTTAHPSGAIAFNRALAGQPDPARDGLSHIGQSATE